MLPLPLIGSGGRTESPWDGLSVATAVTMDLVDVKATRHLREAVGFDAQEVT